MVSVYNYCVLNCISTLHFVSEKMTRTLILMAVIFFTVSFSVLTDSTLVQSPTCNSNLEDQNIADPSHCEKYFRCVYGRPVPKQCPEKMLFNPSIGNCDLYYNVDCPTAENDYLEDENLVEAIENLTGRSFIRNRKVDQNYIEEQVSTNFEGKSGETSTLKFVYLPHESYDNAYYKIENGEKLLVFCEQGMVFSFDLEICATRWSLDQK